MQSLTAKIKEFVAFVAKHIRGDEKGQAQVFLDRLFQAFGHAGVLEMGGEFEYRVHPGKGTKFADLVWPKRVLIEMKKRGEKLQHHYLQARDYWMNLTKDRARYVVLCNFDEFWIYDFDYQMNEPVDRVPLADLATRYTALNFLFPIARDPQFKNDLVKVTRKAAYKVANAFNSMVQRDRKPVPRERAQRFILQCVVGLFAEDIELLPRGFFTEVLNDCKKPGGSSYDLLGGLFRQMAAKKPADGGRFQEVPYFNGGIFDVVDPVDLTAMELTLLHEAAQENWAKIEPAIFGTLFEGSMDKKERHAFGAHFTSEADIQKVVQPTIIRPWRERAAAVKTDADRGQLLKDLHDFRVLDPACGSGNFLYVAYREMRRLEWDIIVRMGEKARAAALAESVVGARQFYGIDIKGFAVELAKVTLMLGKKLALDERDHFFEEQHLHFDTTEHPLPMDNLDANIRCDDALFCDWPKADAIIGNPPYLDARKTTVIHGIAYSKRLRDRFPGVPGRADFCVHWFRRAHEELREGGRAGLVGTNTVRQNYSREGGLDYVVSHGGTITEAISTQVWSGDAAVHVSIVNWLKGSSPGPKKILTQRGDHRDGPWVEETVDRISASLSASCDVTSALRIGANRRPKVCLEGQQPGHRGFCIGSKQVKKIAASDSDWASVIWPFLNGDNFLSGIDRNPAWVIDFGKQDMLSAKRHAAAFEHLRHTVLPDWTRGAQDERMKTGKSKGEHQGRLQRWWLLKRRRGKLVAGIARLSRYIICSAVTKRPAFEFISSEIRPSNALKAFLLQDDYSFGVIQSSHHWEWFKARCSTLKGDFRYTPDTVFDTFPWPQKPSLAHVKKVATAAFELRAFRRKVMADNNWSLRDLYRTLELPGLNPLRDVHGELDDAVRAAYGMKANADVLAFLLELNHQLAAAEKAGRAIVGPGLPPCVSAPAEFITSDCVEPPVLK